jgi:hypothetical protein
MKSIEITVSATGEVSIEATGFKGNACEKATKAIEAALGTVAARKKKPEYHSIATTTTGTRLTT